MEHPVEIYKIIMLRSAVILVVTLLSWLVLSRLTFDKNRCRLLLLMLLPAIVIVRLFNEVGEFFLSTGICIILFVFAAIWLTWLIAIIISMPVLWLMKKKLTKRWQAAWLVILMVVVLCGVYNGYNEIVVNHYTIEDRRLTKPVRIVQLSDLHIGKYIDQQQLQNIIAITIAQQPDIVIVTGDLIDDLSQMLSAEEKLSYLSQNTKYGTFFCYGNHDYFRDPLQIAQALECSNITILKNNGISVSIGADELYLAGVDYIGLRGDEEKRQQLMKQSMQAALLTRKSDSYTILLAHHPDYIPLAAKQAVDLTLAGHTHGGQIGIDSWSPFSLFYQYMRGWFATDNYRSYVNVGSGHWFPFRIGCEREVTVIDIRP